jgi:4'-phosphopantetheinyl transferase
MLMSCASQLQSLTLERDDVHVWRAALDLELERTQSLYQVLTTDEQGRAERFNFPKDCDHFVVARGLLRTILGRYLNMEPVQLRFAYGPNGKPALTEELGGNGLCFNLSHSGGTALYAITRGREVGVDIEHIRPDPVDEQIGEPFFSPQEVAKLRSLPLRMRPAAFFERWVFKEAYLKARGAGLTLPLNQVEVSVVSGKSASPLKPGGSPHEAEPWSLQALNVGPGYKAALAVEGQGLRVEYRQWSE